MCFRSIQLRHTMCFRSIQHPTITANQRLRLSVPSWCQTRDMYSWLALSHDWMVGWAINSTIDFLKEFNAACQNDSGVWFKLCQRNTGSNMGNELLRYQWKISCLSGYLVEMPIYNILQHGYVTGWTSSFVTHGGSQLINFTIPLLTC